jgi:hypothetical protein
MNAQDPHLPHKSTRRRVAGRLAGVTAAILVLSLPVAVGAQAATAPAIDTSALQTALNSLPGVNQGQVQTLVNDLNSVANGGSPATLGSDLNNILGTIAGDSGVSGLVPAVTTALNDIANGTATPADIDNIINQLETLANNSGVPATVTHAADELVGALTTANLPQLLGQLGSPLSSQQIQSIIDELNGLQGLAPGASVPAGALSALGGALDSVASQAGVPPAVASALEDIASTLDSGNPVSPSTLSSLVPAIESVVPSLDSVPVTGPGLGSLVGALGTSLGATPPAGNGGAGGAGGTGAGSSGGSTGSGSTSASAKIGTQIGKVTYSSGKLHVALSCPAKLTAGCHTTVYAHVGSWRAAWAAVKMKAGAKRTVSARLPQFATTAARHKRLTLTVTATTGSFNTHNHTIHIRLAAKTKSK